MLKLTCAAVIFAGVFAVPAMAEDMMCDDASMMKMEKQIDGVKDMAMKDKAMKEMMMAKDSMKMNKMDDCKMHMDNAMKNAM